MQVSLVAAGHQLSGDAGAAQLLRPKGGARASLKIEKKGHAPKTLKRRCAMPNLSRVRSHGIKAYDRVTSITTPS
jgi:hypothetical protein